MWLLVVSFSFSRQLCVCLEHILKHDFPDKWNGIVPQIHAHISSDVQATWLGSLLALYQISKKYEWVVTFGSTCEGSLSLISKTPQGYIPSSASIACGVRKAVTDRWMDRQKARQTEYTVTPTVHACWGLIIGDFLFLKCGQERLHYIYVYLHCIYLHCICSPRRSTDPRSFCFLLLCNCLPCSYMYMCTCVFWCSIIFKNFLVYIVNL